jgi:predicted O-methyltransferase YrrM
MKTKLFVCLALATLFVTKTSFGQEPTDLAKFRESFIEDFPRIGMNSAPEDAMLLRIMIESTKCKKGVEVGSATGYGAIVMGVAFEKNGGHLTTVDIDPKMVKAARQNVAKMKLEKTVKVVEGDALKVLPTLEGHYDFVYIDAAKSDYLKYFKALEPKLVPGAVIIADNVIRSASAMQDFLSFIANSPKYHSVQIRASMMKNDGMLVIYKVQ